MNTPTHTHALAYTGEKIVVIHGEMTLIAFNHKYIEHIVGPLYITVQMKPGSSIQNMLQMVLLKLVGGKAVACSAFICRLEFKLLIWAVHIKTTDQ